MVWKVCQDGTAEQMDRGGQTWMTRIEGVGLDLDLKTGAVHVVPKNSSSPMLKVQIGPMFAEFWLSQLRTFC